VVAKNHEHSSPVSADVEHDTAPALALDNKPPVDQLTVDQPTVDQPTVDQPTVDQPTVDQPTVDLPTVDLPTTPNEKASQAVAPPSKRSAPVSPIPSPCNVVPQLLSAPVDPAGPALQHPAPCDTIALTAPAAPAAQALTAINKLVLPQSVLPQNSTLSLTFANHQSAIDAMEDKSPAWMSPSPDSTIPTTLDQRRVHVRQLLSAFLNRDDIRNAGRYKRWTTGDRATGEDYFYTKASMEEACWDMIDIAVRLHTLGPSSLRIHDRAVHNLILKDRNLTFDEHMLHLSKLVCFFTSKCEDLMKGEQVAVCVAAPKQKLWSCLDNN
jgi:hypothetical protein